ncbi:tetratricopeptide repeat protein [Arenimonas oryziterrae]|uniref:Uncharacterized protein n=1 Tax=Arenimonas oryziterrae DSM 21050 = YC6267 TaxID=1121015 RepID=A0A091BK51_9GAMM|nr:tetratricopeptide repeat protein [Arenimonas oryziterrae]KFN44705.1 hypothetical protein N789_01445 [Arenimonas oryziterrae DSM 21050 = YC6267]
MTFYLLAALLVVVAIAFATQPLWRNARPLAIVLVILLPLAGGGLYALKGNRDALDPGNLAQPKTIDEAVAMLEKRMAADPENAEGWLLLARTYMELQKFDLANSAYARVFALQPEDPDVAVEYAEAQMRAAADHRFPPQAVALLEATLVKQPDSQRALFFLGMHRMQSGQPAEAAALWEKVLPTLSPDTAVVLRQQIDAARASAQMPPLPPPAVAEAATLTITLDIDPALRAQAQPGDTVFVFARGIDGAGPPLAVKRLVLDQLPVTITLSDADSPMPAAKLSAQSRVRLMARLSKSGNAQVGSGDLEASPVEVAVGDKKTVSLTLSRAIP